MSARTHSILQPPGAPAASSQKPRKLRREERERQTGSVLPPPSQWNRGPIVYGHATGMSTVGQTGYQTQSTSGYQAARSYGSGAFGGQGVGTTGYGSVASSYTAGGPMGTSSLRGGSYGGGTGQGASGGGKLQQKIDEAKEKRRERHQARRKPDEISTRSLVRDEQGVAHDSEYVQFRTATPLHVQKRQQTIAENPEDDDSASSSSGSSTSSGFRSSPYTYQSTHRTASSSHHHSSASAIPSHIASHHRSSIDSGLTPRQSSRDRHGAPSSLYGDSAAYDRIGPGYGSRVTTSQLRSASTPTMHHPHGHTTASYQPPAPAFNPRYGPDAALRNPTSDGSSLAESTAQLSLGSGTIDGGGGATSGYTKAIKAGHAASSIRPPQMEGSALDAGVHGMKRQADLFKLETRLFAHKLAKKATRKLAL